MKMGFLDWQKQFKYGRASFLYAMMLMGGINTASGELSIQTQSMTDAASTETTLDNQSTIAFYQQLAKQKNLAEHKVWQRLFYANKAHTSEVKYQGFFIHPDGQKNLALELDATIERLFSDNSENSPQCRFPARTQWLIDALKIPKESLPNTPCQEFQTWFDTINPNTLTLVFATDYMGNPSSMFGHTLLRIDPPKIPNKNMDLVAYALNYAAMTPPNENSAMYAYKGLMGKYAGEYSLMRYFHKTKEYGDIESRDLWEYELNLKPEEVQFIIKHIWEMKHVDFPYFFMSKNCSYALLGLVDLVRPDLDLQQKFSWTVVPIETIKSIKKAGLIQDERYRPALETKLKAQEKQYGKTMSKLAHSLTQPKITPEQILTNKDTATQAGLLEMAYDDLYLQQSNKKVEKDFAQERLRTLLLLRSQLDVPKQRNEPSRPLFDPTQGHGDKSIGIGVGRQQDHDTISLQHRIAYHGLSDPYMGYATGQLLFLDGSLLLQNDKIKVDYFNFLSVNAINPVTSYKTPRSWGTEIGYRQVAVDGQGKFSTDETHGVGVLAGQTGYSKAFFDNQLVCGGYLRGEMQAGKALDDGFRVGISPKLQCNVFFNPRWQGGLTLNMPYWHDSKKWQTQLSTEFQYNINPQNVIRVTANHESQNGQNWQKAMLSYQHYY